MSLIEAIQNKVQTIIERALVEGLPNFQVAAGEVVAEQQFDFMLTTAKGFGALAKKFACNQEIHQLALQCQENALRLLGLLPKEYVEAKQMLEEEVGQNKNLKDKQEKELAKLRNEFKIIDSIDAIYKDLETNPTARQKYLLKFYKHLEDNWVEEDLIALDKRPDESEKEFRIRKELNDHLKIYHDMRKSYEIEKNKINAPYQKQIETIAQDFERKINQVQLSKEQALHKIDDDYKEAVKALKIEQDGRPVVLGTEIEEITQAIKQLLDMDQKTFFDHDQAVNVFEKQKQNLIENNRSKKEVYDKAAKLVLLHPDITNLIYNADALKEVVLQDLETSFSVKEKELQASHQREVSLVEAQAQVDVKQLELDRNILIQKLDNERKQKITEIDKTYYAELENADDYYTKEIAPRKRALKCEQINKLFAVQAATFQPMIDQFLDHEPALDSETVAFFSHLTDSVNNINQMIHLVYLAGDIAVKFMEDYEGDFAQVEDKKSFMSKVVERVIQEVELNVPGTIKGMGLEFQQIYDCVVKDMYDHAQFHVPAEMTLDEAAYVPTMLDFMPDTLPEPIDANKRGMTFFDMAKQFQDMTLWTAYSPFVGVYGALQADNPELCFEGDINPAAMFFQAMEEEVNAVLMDMVPIMKRSYEALSAQKLLPEHETFLKGMLKKIEKIESKQVQVEKEFQSLLEDHPRRREQYIKEKALYEQLKAEKKSIEEQLDNHEESIAQIKVYRDEAIRDFQLAHLGDDAVKASKDELRELEKRFQEKLNKIEENYRKDLTKIEQEDVESAESVNFYYGVDLDDHDAETKNGVNALIQEAIAKKKYESSYFGTYYYHLLAAKTWSQQDLDEFLRKEGGHELREAIKKFKLERREDRKIIEKALEERLAEEKELTSFKKDELLKKRAHDEDGVKHEYTLEQKNLLIKYELKEQKGQEELGQLQAKYETKLQELEGKKVDLKTSLESRLEQLDKDIEAQRSKLVKISSDYHTKLEAFKKHKKELVKDTESVIQDALEHEPKNEPILLSLRSILGNVFSNAKLLQFSDLVKNAVLDKQDWMGLDMNQILRKKVEERVVRAVPETQAERSRLNKVMMNMNQITTRSVVEFLCGPPLKRARLFAQHLDPTLRAQQQLGVQQKHLDQYTAEQGLTTKVDIPKLMDIDVTKPNPYRYPKIKNLMRSLSEHYHFMAKAVVKGFAFATIAHISSKLLRLEIIPKSNNELDNMLNNLQKIHNLKNRSKALKNVEKVFSKLENQEILEDPYRKRLSLESIKLDLMKKIQAEIDKNKQQQGWKHLFKTSDRNRDLANALVSIRDSQDVEQLKKFLNDIPISQFPLPAIVQEAKEKLDQDEIFQPKPGERIRLERPKP